MRLRLKRAIHRLHGGLPLRVTLDGQDITTECYAADAVKGFALCYKRGDSGGFALDEDYCPVREIRRGKVDIFMDGVIARVS